MNPTGKKRVLPLGFLVFASIATAAAPALLPTEAKLIGAWQQGLQRVSGGAKTEQLQRAKKAGLLGGIVQYNADHTFVMYPPCNAKSTDLRKAGVDAIKGTWELIDADKLITKVEFQGRSLAIETKLTWKDDQLVLINKDGAVANQSERYQGSLPPTC